MKSYKTKIYAVLLSSIFIASCGGSADTPSQNADISSKPTVALTTEQVNVVVGDVFTVDIAMSNFPVSEGGGVSVRFDATMLNASDVTINSVSWDFVNKVSSIDNATGVISDILFSSYNGVTGDSPIATITFNAVASGSSQIILESSSINPFSSDGSMVTTNFVSSNVQIAAAQ